MKNLKKKKEKKIDTFEEEEPIDLNAVSERIASIDKEIVKIDEQLAVYLRELGL